MATQFSDIHPDIIRTQLLPRLDGCTLAAVSCVSAELRSLSTGAALWSHICHHMWPSTCAPPVRHLISTFPDGPISFFSQAFPLLHPSSNLRRPPTSPPPEVLISAVDIFYRGDPVLSKTHETETGTGWFRSAPFRIDILDTKEVVPTPIMNILRDDTCQDLYGDLELSWIVVDPIGRRAVNVTSMKPVSVHRHWLTGEIQARFATVVEGAGIGGEAVVCAVEVTCAAAEEEGNGRLKIREVGLEVEDLEGTRLSGRDSVGVIQRGMEWGRRVAAGGRGGGERRRRKYEEFVERRREMKEKKRREEGRWEMVYVAVVVSAFAAVFVRLLWLR